MSCCHHKIFTHQEPPTNFDTYWTSDLNICHVGAGMGPGFSASDDLPWKEALGLSLHWRVCGHSLGGSRKTGSWGAGEMSRGRVSWWLVRRGLQGAELEAPGSCRKCCWFSIQPQHPPTCPEGKASCGLPHRRVSVLWGWQTQSPLAPPLPEVLWHFLPQGTFQIPVSPAHEFKDLEMG